MILRQDNTTRFASITRCLKLLWFKSDKICFVQKEKYLWSYCGVFLLDLRFFNNIKLGWFKWMTLKLTSAHVNQLAWRVMSTDCNTCSKSCVGNLKIILFHLLKQGHTGVKMLEERAAQSRSQSSSTQILFHAVLPPSPRAPGWITRHTSSPWC